MIGFWLCLVYFSILPVVIIYNLIVWKTAKETWSWIHKQNRFTGEIRSYQKIRGVPLSPPKRSVGED